MRNGAGRGEVRPGDFHLVLDVMIYKLRCEHSQNEYLEVVRFDVLNTRYGKASERCLTALSCCAACCLL